MKLYAPSTINEIKDRFGFRFSKTLGQNFLTDKNIIDEIVRGAQIGISDIVIEIGPGIGVITYEAAENAARVIAVEIDSNLMPVLEYTLKGCPNVTVVNKDIMKTDVNELIEATVEELKRNNREIAGELLAEGRKEDAEAVINQEYNVKVIGNLPYYITTPIIMKLLEEKIRAKSITVMMQKEVADRIKSGPGTKDYGALSLAVQYYASVTEVVRVPKTVFMPRPQVDSTVLRLDLLDEKPVKVMDEDMLFKVIRAGFGQRRKTLNNSLMGVEGITKDIVKEALLGAEIDPVRRAETLSLEEFARLSDEITRRM